MVVTLSKDIFQRISFKGYRGVDFVWSEKAQEKALYVYLYGYLCAYVGMYVCIWVLINLYPHITP